MTYFEGKRFPILNQIGTLQRAQISVFLPNPRTPIHVRVSQGFE